MAFGALESTIGNSHRPDRRDLFLADPRYLGTNEMHEEILNLFERRLKVPVNSEMVDNLNRNRDLFDAVIARLGALPNTLIETVLFQQQGDNLVATFKSTPKLTALSKKAYSITPDLNYGHEKLSMAVREVAQSESLDSKYIYRIVSPYFAYSEDELTGSAVFSFLELTSHS